MFSRRLLGSCRAIPKVHRVHAASRRLTTAAEPPASTSSVVSSSPLADEDDDDVTYQKRPRKGFIHTSVIVNRHPMLTRTPTAFERAYYAYHSRIERALHNPFPSEFYFKPGSLLEGKFDEEEKAREKEAFGHMPWLEYDQKKNVIASDLVSGEEVVKPMPRETEADRKGDVKSLDRKGERNLYLLTKTEENGKEVWKFPQTELVEEELPHEAVKRDLRSPYGIGMDTWIVSRIPIGIYQPNPTAPPFEQTHVFFYKAHILQGQVRPDGKKVADFAWLTKQEIKPRVEESYWNSIKNILSDF